MPSTEEVFREVSETLRVPRVEKYGPDELSAGPEVDKAKEIIIVEGRADVINLLRLGIENVVALEGAKVPETIIKLSKEKTSTALLDGDRGGDLILKELLQVTDVKYVARAPQGKEIEECTSTEVFNALKNKVPIDEFRARKPRERPKVLVPKQIKEARKELEGTLEAVLFGEKMEQIERLPVSALAEKLQQTDGVDTVVFDGVITQRLVDIASDKGIKFLVAARVSDQVKPSLKVHLLTFAEMEG
jgi:DNA primase